MIIIYIIIIYFYNLYNYKYIYYDNNHITSVMVMIFTDHKNPTKQPPQLLLPLLLYLFL